MMIMTKTKFWKQISILSILFIIWGLFLVSGASADINWAASANGGVASETGASGSPSGAVANTNDEDYATYWKRWDYHCAIGEQISIAKFTIQIAFDHNIPLLEKIKYKIHLHTKVDVYSKCEKKVSCSIKQGDIWTEVGTSTSDSVEIEGSWHNVSHIKLYLYAYARAGHDVGFQDSWAQAGAWLYELEAWEPYQDIGLRVFDGTETIAIAAEPTGTLTSPLRIAKNGTIYGIVLVDPGDLNDSGVRIQTSSGIKALRKYP